LKFGRIPEREYPQKHLTGTLKKEGSYKKAVRIYQTDSMGCQPNFWRYKDRALRQARGFPGKHILTLSLMHKERL
jgi:hypothetical protein